MVAFIPHKDTLFLLASIQRDFIAKCTALYGTLYPQYPLWAFFDKENEMVLLKNSANIMKCEIESPRVEKNNFFFPVTFTFSNENDSDLHTLQVRIIFAKTDYEIHKDFDFSSMKDSNVLPLSQRVFRIGTVILENNGWSLFDDHWIKLTNKK